MEEEIKISLRCPRKLKDKAREILRKTKYQTISNFVRMKLWELVEGEEK